MRAVVVEPSGELTWGEVPDVAPDHGEILIKVTCAGVNRADLLQVAGKYPPPPGASPVLGPRCPAPWWGWVTRPRAGKSGKKSALCCPEVDTRSTLQCPAVRCSPAAWDRTAGSRRATGSGLHGVVQPGDDREPVRRPVGAHPRGRQRDRHPRHPGGASPGRPRRRHRRVPEKLQLCRDLGAELTINYRDEDFVSRVKEASGGEGADVILDIMGRPT